MPLREPVVMKGPDMELSDRGTGGLKGAPTKRFGSKAREIQRGHQVCP